MPDLRRALSRRRLAALLLSSGGLVLALWTGAAWWAAREIASPARRPLQDYHLEILQAPSARGMKVESFALDDGTPVLLCLPDPAASHAGERGTRLREQLIARGIALPPPGASNGATLVLLHGRRGRKEDNLPIAERFCAAGFRCLSPDLPAHGDHPQDVATYGIAEASLPGLALARAAALQGFPASPAGLWGISMGGSVSVHAAAKNPDTWGALVVVVSFDALSPVIGRKCEQRLGAGLGPYFHGAVDRFFARRAGHHLAEIHPAALAPRITIPALLAHGDDDPLIPPEAALHLHDQMGSPVKRWIDVGSGTHGNVLITPHPLYADMAEWFLLHLGE